MNIQPKTYLIYGDSGAGKSSFINCLEALDDQGNQSKTGAGGKSVTIEAGKLYFVDHNILGPLRLIDTRGTWDPEQSDNDQILQDLVTSLIELSVSLMKEDSFKLQYIYSVNLVTIDGILFIHSSLNYARYARDQRINHLSSLLGTNLLKSTITIFSHYSELLKLDSIKMKFEELLDESHHEKESKKIIFPYVFWDSGKAVDGQFLQLKQEMQNDKLKSFHLQNIQTAGDQIMELAIRLRDEDIEEREITEYKTETIKKTDLVSKKQDIPYNISLCIKTPQSTIRSVLTLFKPDIYYGIEEHTYVKTIRPNFPQGSLDPIVSKCYIKSQIIKNVELIEQPQLNDSGDNYELKLKYRWKAVESQDRDGQIELVIISEIVYKEKFSYETEKVRQTIVTKWLPKSTDAKIYLRQAQQKIMEDLSKNILSDIKQSQDIKLLPNHKNQFENDDQEGNNNEQVEVDL